MTKVEEPLYFLRSINVRLDAAHPDRIAHFRPTAKGLQFVKALLADTNERAHMVVAPYGSGKSLAATFLLQAVENRQDARKVLRDIGGRLSAVSPDLNALLAERIRRKQRGLVLALQGHAPSVAGALREASTEALRRLGLARSVGALRKLPTATQEDLVALLDAILSIARERSLDRVVVVWDEFGRHLETLVAEGKPGALLDVQLVAEIASRSSDVPLSIGLLLHRGLLNYAANMPQSVLASWKQVEGRFKTLQYIDDSKELYRLAAEVAEAKRTVAPGSGVPVLWAAKQAHSLGLFPDFSESELTDLLSRAYPLDPVTLHLLPRLAARVAQNERTLFGFLNALVLRKPVRPEDLFDYFSPAMQADIGPGGTSKAWLESQSALLKCLDVAGASRVIKTASLLALGSGGERSRASRDLLLFALAGYEQVSQAGAVVDALLDRKLLLHRRHNDEVAVWHGTDLDLRTRLDEEKARQRSRFDLLAVLRQEVPPAVWRPVEYNDDLGIRRYADGQYLTVQDMKGLFGAEWSLPALEAVPDARIVYLLAENAESLRDAGDLVRQAARSDRYILAIPREPLSLSEAAVEVWSLLQLLRDSDLVASDPFAAAEIGQMLDDARGHLRKLAEKLTRPSAEGPRWFHSGKELTVSGPRELRGELSRVMRKVFSKTPRILNEMIVRHRPSPVVINARKKLVMGLLERAGEDNLGLQGNFPDSSMHRTVLVRTGLYTKAARGWRFAKPSEIQDPGLRAVWSVLQDFFVDPSDTPKCCASLIGTLSGPPYGVRAGLIPILVAAALRAFPSSISLTKDEHYLGDILPSEIETLCREPERFQVRVLRLNRTQLEYVNGFLGLLGIASATEEPQDMLRLAFDALEAWKGRLPAGAWTSSHLTETARALRDVFRRETDPHSLLFVQIPRACGMPRGELGDVGSLVGAIRAAMDELVGITQGYRAHAEQTVRRMMALGAGFEGSSLPAVASAWAACFQDAFVSRLANGIDKGLISRAAATYDTPDLLLDSISSLLLGKTVDRWDDGAVAAFERELQSVVRRIEDTAIADSSVELRAGGGAEALGRLVVARISSLQRRLEGLVGKDAARRLLSAGEGQPILKGGRRGNAS